MNFGGCHSTHNSPASYYTIVNLYDQKRVDRLTGDDQTQALSTLFLSLKIAHLSRKSFSKEKYHSNIH